MTPDQRYVMTDVELINLESRLLGGAPATVTYWLASAPANRRTVSLLEAGKAYRLIDIIADGLNLATGVTDDTLVIEVPQQAGGAIGASAHTYQLDIVSGTTMSSSFGAGMSAVSTGQLVGAGGRVRVPLFGGNYRSDVVVTNPTAGDLTVTVRFFGNLGFPYSTTTRTLAPGNTVVVPDPQNRRAGTATVTVDASSTGQALVYLKVRHAATGDHFVLVGR